VNTREPFAVPTDERVLLPLFPLPGTVFLPNTILPLHVFEHRYRTLLSDIQEGDGIVVIPRLKPGWEANYGGAPPIFHVAGFGKIIRCQRLPDGRSNVVILGLGRIQIGREVPTDAPYRVAQCDVLHDDPSLDGARALKQKIARLRVMAGQALGDRPAIAQRIQQLIEIQSDPIAFVDGMAHLILPNVDARQAFLEITQLNARIDSLQGVLASTMYDAELRVS
jgi:Lon protease-like protein